MKSGDDYKNKSRLFLLPMLGIKLLHINKEREIDYLIDVNFLQIGFPQIILIFDNFDYEPLKEDIYRISNISEYIDCEYSDDDKEVVLFFDVPLKFKKDFELFVKGKYSKFSENYKKVLIEEYKSYRNTGLNKFNLPKVSIYDAIYPLESTRRMIADELEQNIELIEEVLDAPNLDKEEFKYIDEL